MKNYLIQNGFVNSTKLCMKTIVFLESQRQTSWSVSALLAQATIFLPIILNTPNYPDLQEACEDFLNSKVIATQLSCGAVSKQSL